MKWNWKFKQKLPIFSAAMVTSSLLIIASVAEENCLSNMTQDSTRVTWGIAINLFTFLPTTNR